MCSDRPRSGTCIIRTVLQRFEGEIERSHQTTDPENPLAFEEQWLGVRHDANLCPSIRSLDHRTSRWAGSLL